MMTCSKCGREDARGVVIFDTRGNPIEYCLYHRPSAYIERAKDLFGDGFTLQHVRGDDGKPITVHSTKELRQVEKERGVALAIMSDDDISKPPQHDPDAGNIARNYKRKWQRDPAAYRPENVTGVSVGVAQSTADTLADAPNPLNH